MNQLLSSVCGFIDSLTVYPKKYPGRASYKQKLLVRDLLKSSYDAHNAIGNVDSLGHLIATCLVKISWFTVLHLRPHITPCNLTEKRASM